MNWLSMKHSLKKVDFPTQVQSPPFSACAGLRLSCTSHLQMKKHSLHDLNWIRKHFEWVLRSWEIPFFDEFFYFVLTNLSPDWDKINFLTTTKSSTAVLVKFAIALDRDHQLSIHFYCVLRSNDTAKVKMISKINSTNTLCELDDSDLSSAYSLFFKISWFDSRTLHQERIHHLYFLNNF